MPFSPSGELTAVFPTACTDCLYTCVSNVNPLRLAGIAFGKAACYGLSHVKIEQKGGSMDVGLCRRARNLLAQHMHRYCD